MLLGPLGLLCSHNFWRYMITLRLLTALRQTFTLLISIAILYFVLLLTPLSLPFSLTSTRIHVDSAARLNFFHTDDTLLIDSSTQLTGTGIIYVAGTLQISEIGVLTNSNISFCVLQQGIAYVPDTLELAHGSLVVLGTIVPTTANIVMSILMGERGEGGSEIWVINNLTIMRH